MSAYDKGFAIVNPEFEVTISAEIITREGRRCLVVSARGPKGGESLFFYAPPAPREGTETDADTTIAAKLALLANAVGRS